MSEARNQISGQRAELWPQYGLSLLVLYATVRAIVAAHIKPFWLDEILTCIMAHQPNVAAIWSGIRQGTDGQPILFYLIERAAAVFPNAEIALRLPSVAGFACVLVSLFVFVRRRSGAVYGLVSAAIAMMTSLYMPYAIEARPYSLVAACVAVALVAYQRVSQLRWAGLMALALATAQCLHYYSIFALIPFAAAEITLSRQMSKVRWRIWIALTIGASPLAVFWPILAHYRIIFGASFWAQPTLAAFVHVYGDFLGVSSYLGLAVAIVCGVALFGEFFSIASRKLMFEGGKPVIGPDGKFLHEQVLVAFLLAIPLVVFVTAKVLHGGYTDRYVLYAALGVPLTAGLILPRLGRRALILFSALLVCAIAMQEASFWFFPRQPLWRLQPPAAEAESLLADAGHNNLPVAVADPFEYPVIAYYASPSFTARLALVAGPTYAESGTAEKALSLMAAYYPFQVYDFRAWRSAHPSFLLYSSLGDLQDWWADQLVHNGYDLRPVASDRSHIVFLVSSTENSRQ